MPEGQEQTNILFGAEFKGQGIAKGVEDILTNLEQVVEAQVLVKQSLNETTTAMKDNRKEAEKLSKQYSLSAAEEEKRLNRIKELNAEFDELQQQQIDLSIVQKKVNETGKEYNKTINEQKKSTELVGKEVKKLTSVNHLAAEGVKKFGNFAKDAAFGLVSGFAGGIIATVIPALLDFVEGLFDTNSELDEFKKNQKIVNDINEEAVKGYVAQTTHLEIIRAKLTDTNIPLKERLRLVDEYNKIADKGNQIDKTQITNLDLINEKIDAQITLIKKRAIAKAAENIIAQKAEKLLKKQFELQEDFPNIFDSGFDPIQERIDIRKGRKSGQSKNVLIGGFAAKEFELNDLIKDQEDLDRTTKVALGLIDSDSLTTNLSEKATKTPKADRAIENVFLQKLSELRARLSAAAAKSFQSEPLIQKQFADQLEKEVLGIDKLVKEKHLTFKQGEFLKGILGQINETELNKSLGDFRGRVAAALGKVNDEIQGLILEDAKKRAENIGDEFEQERQTIEENFNTVIQGIKDRSDRFKKQVDADTEAGLLSPELAKRKKFVASLLYGSLVDDAEQAKLNAQADLAFKKFQKTLDVLKKPFEEALLTDNENTTKLIQEQTAIFMSGKISYKEYQKNLTDILKAETARRRKIQLEEAQAQLKLINDQLKGTTNAKQKEELEKQRDALRSQISTLQRDPAEEPDDEQKRKLDTILAYVNAIMSVAEAVVSFWQQVNQAEAEALDRSIALQNKRVENAREIADKGNAEYLEMEQKRLDELEKKRADNARKQIAINNALTASQAIVAAISAIATAAQSGNPLAAIAAVAAVIGAIGAAFQFVNSLQPQEPGFFEGTEYVTGPGGRDNVRARLTPGERVVTAKKNEEYWNTLSAIHNGTIPADALNSFVESYPNLNIPIVDFDRLSQATDGKMGGDSLELLSRVDGLNDTMKQVVVGLGELGIHVNMDEEGFAASIRKAGKTRKMRSRA